MRPENPKRVVIVGAGFGGLNATRVLANSPLAVTVIDRNNYHTFLPLLYQVSAAEIEPEQIAAPVRVIFRRSRNLRFVRGEVSEISYAGRFVRCLGERIPFDWLILATGSANNFFNVAGAERFSFPLKTLDDGMVLRNHILTCFERASFAADTGQKKRLLTVAIIGGGATGVEFAGALAELVHGPLKRDFPELAGEPVRVVLVEASPRPVSMLDARLSTYVTETLRRKGVEVRLGTRVERIDAGRVTLSGGEVIETETVVWTAGVRGEKPAGDLTAESLPPDRLRVDEHLRLVGYPEIFVIGDLAYAVQDGRPLPMVAPVAIQQGRYVGQYLLQTLRGKPTPPFRYRDKGTMVVVGRNQAVTQLAGLKWTGFFSWLIWIFVHILYLIGFRHKLFVMMSWVWNYLFFDKSVRLILPRCCANPMSVHCQNRSCGYPQED